MEYPRTNQEKEHGWLTFTNVERDLGKMTTRGETRFEFERTLLEVDDGDDGHRVGVEGDSGVAGVVHEHDYLI